jgi:hypothetical protein
VLEQARSQMDEDDLTELLIVRSIPKERRKEILKEFKEKRKILAE